jgi:hypothetical protein
MKHINQLAQQLQISPELVRSVCQSLGLSLKPNDTVDETVEQQLVQLKEVASREGISLEEAAQHLIEMRDTHSESSCDRSFNKREYIKQRFGVDPETAAPDSFVGMLYQDTHRGTQLGELRHKVVLETSTLALEEFVFNGIGTNLTPDEYTQAQERINSRIDNDFFAKVNWGEGSHPLLVGTSTQQPKQLKSSQTKTGQSPKK